MRASSDNNTMFGRMFGCFKSPDFVIGYKYKAFVLENVLDSTHGGGHEVPEIFIPSKKVIFNSGSYVFSSDRPSNERNYDVKKTVEPLIQVSISRELAERLSRMACLENKIKEEKKFLHEEFILAITGRSVISEPIIILGYKIKVYRGISDAIHGGKSFIEEYFIPSHEVVYSENHMLMATEPRNTSIIPGSEVTTVSPITECVIPKKLADKIQRLAKLQEEIKVARIELQHDDEFNDLLTHGRGLHGLVYF